LHKQIGRQEFAFLLWERQSLQVDNKAIDDKVIINSPDFREYKFYGGRGQAKESQNQTQIYAKCLLEHLPEWIAEDIKKQHLSICDWGCADGQAVEVYCEYFPDNKICGVDVSESAINNASIRLSGREFYVEDWLTDLVPARIYDVVITSHVLEHFERPVEVIIPRLLQFINKYLLILVPFEEQYPLCKEHCLSFNYESFPVVIKDATCVYFDVIQPGLTGWKGKQLVVVYMKNVPGTFLELKELYRKVFDSHKNILKENFSGSSGNDILLCKLNNELEVIKNSRSYRLINIYRNIRKLPRKLLRKIGRKIKSFLSKRKQQYLLYKRRIYERDLEKLSQKNVSVLSKKCSLGQEYNVASVMDTFTYSNLSGECNLQQLTPLNWRQEFERYKPDFLFIESAWRGKDDLWRNRINYSGAIAGVELFKLLLWCKKKAVPSIFWCKEDPPHFNRFVGTARHFDYIFTTAQECIIKYKRCCGHDRVYPLLFAAQPKLQNPVLETPRNNRICFAGTYHNNKYKQRTEELCMLLRTAKNFGLDIYDRNINASIEKRRNCQFPSEFNSNILGSLEFDQMNRAYRKYKVFLNVNSVANSKTMFARRVFELLASGTPVVSNYSKGIENIFGDIVQMVETEDEAQKALERLMYDEEYWRRTSARGVREVMRNHTYRHRFHEVLGVLGVDVNLGGRPVITVILKAGTDQLSCIEMLKKQTFQPGRIVVDGQTEEIKELLSNLKAAGYNAEALQREKNLETFHAGDKNSFFAVMDGKDYYGPEYLHDAVDALGYCNTDITTMDNVYREKGSEIAFSSAPASECMMINTIVSATVVAKGCVLNSALLEKLLTRASFKVDFPVYSRYAFEYIQLDSSGFDWSQLMEKVCL
jgi:spore maturation protein CgeB